MAPPVLRVDLNRMATVFYTLNGRRDWYTSAYAINVRARTAELIERGATDISIRQGGTRVPLEQVVW